MSSQVVNDLFHENAKSICIDKIDNLEDTEYVFEVEYDLIEEPFFLKL